MRGRWALGLVVLACCAGQRGGAAAWPGALCEARLGAAAPAEAGASLAVPPSRVLVDVRLDVGEALSTLERALPRRLAERRGVPIGDAGRLSYTIDRGPFSVRTEGDELAVEVGLTGQAEVCKPLGPLGCVGYASCAPGGHASASLRLLLTDDYRVLPSRVQIPVTRPCALSALSVDVTTEVQTQANRQADELRKAIDGTVPALDGAVASLWRALHATVPLGGSSCVRINPGSVLQTGPRLRGGALTVGLGVEGDVRVETPCGAPAPAAPLPPPRLDRDLPSGVELHIPLVTSWPEVSLALARSLALAEPLAGAEPVHVTDVQALPHQDGRVRLGLTLAGRACGQAWFDATPTPQPGGTALTQLRPAEGEAARARRASPGLDLDALAASLSGRLRVPWPAEVAGMHRRIERLAARLLGGDAGDGPLRYEVSVTMNPVEVTTVVASREGLAALAVARGDAGVKLRPAEAPAPVP